MFELIYIGAYAGAIWFSDCHVSITINQAINESN